MAAALFRAATGLSVRRIHGEFCRVMWTPQAARFSSKPSDRDPPRRTHIKKAKAQPAEEADKGLDKFFSERRPATAPPAVGEELSKAAAVINTSSAQDPHEAANRDSLEKEEEKASKAEAMIPESTLAEVKADVGSVEADALQETCDSLQKGAEELAKELEVKMPIEDVSVSEGATEVDNLTLDSIPEAADTLEAETSAVPEAVIGSEQGPIQSSDTDQELRLNDGVINQNKEKGAAEPEGNVLEAMSLESVTLAEVEVSLGTLESKSLSETSTYLEKEAAVLAVEKKMEVEEETTTKEMTEATHADPLSLPEVVSLPEDVQTDALMEKLLFTVPANVEGARESQIIEEAVTADSPDVVTASVDNVAAESDHPPAPPLPLKEELLVQEEERATGDKEDTGTHTDLDPVQRLFLEKIREYTNMHRSNAGFLEAEPDYQKNLSEETAKLQRVYGGGDLSSFPQFTFNDPKLDQESK
ncbi:neurofilament heavy polypeptide-like [Simochromis diagramma]|uniref:neurofilament heavy polypeptide-like n=1 Tax=Simochromis diagramma TaxID=43689 RepID=UPI001A7E2594|nr:neurofilament heavy polypeptide-like [Simochromis diagramma]